MSLGTAPQVPWAQSPLYSPVLVEGKEGRVPPILIHGVMGKRCESGEGNTSSFVVQRRGKNGTSYAQEKVFNPR